MLFFLFVLSSACVPRSPTLPVEEHAETEEAVRRFLRLGTKELRTEDKRALERAAAYYQLARELRPNDPRALDGLGSVEFRRGRMLAARTFFRAAYLADPRYDRAIEHLAAIAETEGKAEEAEKLLRRAIAVNPLNYRARNNLAVLLRAEKGYSDAARAELLKAAAIFERSPQPLLDNPLLIEKNLSPSPAGSEYDLRQ